MGATSNPVIVGEVLKKEMSVKAAGLLAPVFKEQHGKNGRLSLQTDRRSYRNTDAIVAQAVRFGALAPNMIVKIPETKAGLQ